MTRRKQHCRHDPAELGRVNGSLRKRTIRSRAGTLFRRSSLIKAHSCSRARSALVVFNGTAYLIDFRPMGRTSCIEDERHAQSNECVTCGATPSALQACLLTCLSVFMTAYCLQWRSRCRQVAVAHSEHHPLSLDEHTRHPAERRERASFYAR